MLQFSSPHLLYLLAAVPVLYLFFLIAHRRRVSAISEMGEPSTLNRFSSRGVEGRLLKEGFFASAALFFFFLALSGPRAGTRLEPVVITGSDVYIAIDLSQSMRAEDVRPNRLQRAKIDALELVSSLQGDRAGLILFAGDGFVQCPLTTDYRALAGILSSIDTQNAVAGGTDLSAPLRVALRSLKPEEDKYAVILLMTDGENMGGDMRPVIRDIRNRGIKIFSIGYGSGEGAPIPIYNDSGARTGYKKDKGTVVITRLEEAFLKELSETTGGYYFKSGKKRGEIQSFLSTLETLKKRELEKKKYTVHEERFQVPLAVGILFLLLYLFTAFREGYRP